MVSDQGKAMKPWRDLGITNSQLLEMVDFIPYDIRTGTQGVAKPIKYPSNLYLRAVSSDTVMIGNDTPVWFSPKTNRLEARFNRKVDKLPYQNPHGYRFAGDTMYYVSNKNSSPPPSNVGNAIYAFSALQNGGWEKVQEVPFEIDFFNFEADRIVVAGPGHIGAFNTKDRRWTSIQLDDQSLEPFASAALDDGYAIVFSEPVKGTKSSYSGAFVKILNQDLTEIEHEFEAPWVVGSPNMSSQITQNPKEYSRF